MNLNQNEINEPFVFAVISGKGGVGKSMFSVNIAGILHLMDFRVLLIDADLGMSNCSTLLNEPVSATVAQWINGECSLEELPQNSHGVTLVTGADDPVQNQIHPEMMMDALDQVILNLAPYYDFVIIDTPAGAGEMTLWALDQAHIGTLLLVDEPTAISDVYRLCKYVYSMDPGYKFASIVNFSEDEESAESTFKRFNTILNYFLEKETSYLGFIPASNTIHEMIQTQETLLQLNTDHPILTELRFIAERMIGVANKTLKPVSNPVHK